MGAPVSSSIVGGIRSAVVSEVQQCGQSFLQGAFAIWLALVFVVLGAATAAVATYLYLATIIPPPKAMAMVSALAFLLALCCALFAWGLLRKPRSEEQTASPTPDSDLAAITGQLEEGIRQGIGRNPKNAAIISLVAGLVIGANPELERIILASTRQ